LPPGVGREAVLKGCGGCHGIGQILTERRSREEWANTVTMMITNGAPVSEAEFDLVVNYLATHFGPR
jgi:quinoprotein glucose dehydrogenase